MCIDLVGDGVDFERPGKGKTTGARAHAHTHGHTADAGAFNGQHVQRAGAQQRAAVHRGTDLVVDKVQAQRGANAGLLAHAHRAGHGRHGGAVFALHRDGTGAACGLLDPQERSTHGLVDHVDRQGARAATAVGRGAHAHRTRHIDDQAELIGLDRQVTMVAQAVDVIQARGDRVVDLRERQCRTHTGATAIAHGACHRDDAGAVDGIEGHRLVRFKRGVGDPGGHGVSRARHADRAGHGHALLAGRTCSTCGQGHDVARAFGVQCDRVGLDQTRAIDEGIGGTAQDVHTHGTGNGHIGLAAVGVGIGSRACHRHHLRVVARRNRQVASGRHGASLFDVGAGRVAQHVNGDCTGNGQATLALVV